MNDGSEAATVEDVIVDVGQGHLLYLVIQFTDDTYRDSDALFPVPIYLFEPDGQQFVLYADNETYIDNMPSIEEVDAYDPDQDDAWGRWMYSFWTMYPQTTINAYTEENLGNEDLGDASYREDRLWGYRYNYASGPQVVPVAIIRGSELIGVEVSTQGGESAGEITDLVVNVENGQLLLVAVRPSAEMEAASGNYLLPLSALTANRETANVVFNNEDYELPSGTGFESTWPDLTDQAFHDQIAQVWESQGVGVRYGAGMQVVPMGLVPDTIMDNYEVFTRDSESIGEIDDLLIRRDGKIVYATFEYDEAWEIDWDQQMSIVPISLLTIQPISQAAVLGARAPDIDSLPKYDGDLFVDTSAPDWDSAVRSYWNNIYAVERGNERVGQIPTTESWESIADSEYLPASALRDFSVVDGNGEWIGEVEEIAIDMVRTEVGYLRLEIDEPGLFADAEVAVPVSAVRFRPAEEQLVLDVTQDRLRNAPGYDGIPTEADRDFVEEVRAYWAN